MAGLFWSKSSSNGMVMETWKFSSGTVVDWFNYFRDICRRYLTLHPIRISGVGHVVEIDESIVAKKKYHVGSHMPLK